MTHTTRRRTNGTKPRPTISDVAAAADVVLLDRVGETRVGVEHLIAEVKP